MLNLVVVSWHPCGSVGADVTCGVVGTGVVVDGAGVVGLMLHRKPENPVGQLHTYPSEADRSTTHVPWFKHGSRVHGFVTGFFVVGGVVIFVVGGVVIFVVGGVVIFVVGCVVIIVVGFVVIFIVVVVSF